MTECGGKKGLPSAADILTHLGQAGGSVNRRDIARAFSLKGQERVYLKDLLKTMTTAGQLARHGKAFSEKPDEAGLDHEAFHGPRGPLVYHGVIASIDSDGGILVDWTFPGTKGNDPVQKRLPLLKPGHVRGAKSFDTLTRGMAVIGGPAGSKDLSSGLRLIKILKKEADDDHVMGVFTATDGDGGVIHGISRKNREAYSVMAADRAGAITDDLVLFSIQKGRGRNADRAVIIRVLASVKEPKSLSLIAIHEHGIPSVFSDDVLRESESLSAANLDSRIDLRDVPLVTIDDEDARDFDDAVFAESDANPDNAGGFHLIVAIADVSYYVRTDSTLDGCGFERGNSVYFPDRVVPMLPERLSNDLCSLRPNEDRPCLGVHMWISSKGALLRHEFVRGMMRSAARLTYASVQHAMDTGGDGAPDGIYDRVLKPLYAAYKALCISRQKRAPLELDLPEERIYLGDDGTITKIMPRPRFASHRLIEEFMILANVAAAITLSDRRAPCLFRIHDQPGVEKVSSLADFLKSINIPFTKGQVMKPAVFNRVLAAGANHPLSHAINELVLRSQSQAVYSPDNIGHFGLNLPRYCHFTSPIRRYADLVVHRALIGACQLPSFSGEQVGDDYAALKSVGEHISIAERRAASAERQTTERYVTAYLAKDVGQIYAARVTGVNDFGLFVRLDDMGAEGLIPVRHLGPDYFIFDKSQHRLTGRRSQKTFTLGDRFKVQLAESHPLSGSLLFTVAGTGGGDKPRFKKEKSFCRGPRAKKDRK